MSINKDDRVLVIAGKDKGLGTVLNVDRVSGRVVVASRWNIVKKTVPQSATTARWDYRRGTSDSHLQCNAN